MTGLLPVAIVIGLLPDVTATGLPAVAGIQTVIDLPTAVIATATVSHTPVTATAIGSQRPPQQRPPHMAVGADGVMAGGGAVPVSA